MPDRHGKLAEVRPIYRTGDRVLVKIPFGYCEMVVQGFETRDGALWLNGRVWGFYVCFPMRRIKGRLAPYQVMGWRA